eukprot:Colp12_sorted_trinity150504_noHs@16938
MEFVSGDALLASRNKLKKATQIRDGSAPRVTKGEHDLTENDIENYQKTVQDANIEVWEKHLQNVTFSTRYLPVTVEEAKAFLDVTVSHREKKTPNAKDVEMLNNLQSRLQDIINESGWATQGVFVKTSSRSAKDAAIAHERLVESYKAHCKKISNPPYPINERIISVLHAGTQMLKCKDAADAMKMLTQSERIEQDMSLALEVFKRNGFWHEHLVIREWHDIEVSQEWRCFISNRKVTAIAQYNYLPYFADLHENREYLKTLITSFLTDTVLPLLPEAEFKDMVVDVAILSPYQNPKPWVIELNPFLSSTDGALFSWVHDGHILGGEKLQEIGVDFRLQEKRSDALKAGMILAWRELIDSVEIDG